MSIAPFPGQEFPLLTPEQIASLARRGQRHVASTGDVLYSAGDRGYDFIASRGAECGVAPRGVADPARMTPGWRRCSAGSLPIGI